MGRFFSRKTAIFTLSLLVTAAALLYFKYSERNFAVAHYLHSFPETVEEVRTFSNQSIKEFEMATLHFINIPPEQRSFENTIIAWDKIGKSLLHRLVVLKSLPIISASPETLAAAEEEFYRLQEYLNQKLKTTPQVFLAIVSYLERASAARELTASEWTYAYQVIQSINASMLPTFYRPKITSLQQGISEIPRLEYTFLEGKSSPKTSDGSKFTVLNLNVCFLPEKLPLLYGGMTPWPERIDQVAAKLLNIDADVICLQEVFEEAPALKLYESLKERYSYFYINIAPKNFGFSEETAGLGSGLFVASKYKVENPAFTLFKGTTVHMNRGFFDFKITSQDQILGHIYTTHLEPFSSSPGPDFRAIQIRQILSKMDKDLSHKTTSGYPIVLCGDLNIPCSSQECAEGILKEHFYDPYNKDRKEVTMDNRTYLDFTELWWKAHMNAEEFKPYPQILDYALILQKLPSNHTLHFDDYEFTTTVIPMNEQLDPITALSDHHGQLTIAQKRQVIVKQ